MYKFLPPLAKIPFFAWEFPKNGHPAPYCRRLRIQRRANHGKHAADRQRTSRHSPGAETPDGTDCSLCGCQSHRKNHSEAGCRSFPHQRIHRDPAVSAEGRNHLPRVRNPAPDGAGQNPDLSGNAPGTRGQGTGIPGSFHLLPGFPADLRGFSPGIPENTDVYKGCINIPPSGKVAVCFFGYIGNDSSILNKKGNHKLFKV